LQKMWYFSCYCNKYSKIKMWIWNRFLRFDHIYAFTFLHAYTKHIHIYSKGNGKLHLACSVCPCMDLKVECSMCMFHKCSIHIATLWNALKCTLHNVCVVICMKHSTFKSMIQAYIGSATSLLMTVNTNALIVRSNILQVTGIS